MASFFSNIKYFNWKTLYFNFKYLPWSQAIKLPIWISRTTYFKNVGGTLRINAPIKSGMIRLGCGNIGIFDDKKSRSIWQVAGSVIFSGKARLGHGTKISVGPKGKLCLGDNFRISAETALVAIHDISIGNNVLLSWDILLMDHDFHKILDSDNNYINPPKAINLGNDIWIGCRSTILKGTVIADNTVIAAGTLVTINISESGTIMGGNPPQIIKKHIHWQR